MAQSLALALIRKNQPKLEALSTKVKAINQKIMADFKNAVVGAKEAGKWLIDMKDLLPHGHFERYVEDHTEIASRTARRYMLLHERWDEIEDKLGPDAYVSTIDGCLKIVAQPTQNRGNRPGLATFPPTEVSDGQQEDHEAESDRSDGGLSPGVAEAAIALRERRYAASQGTAADAGGPGPASEVRNKTPKDPSKAIEADLENLFGELTRKLEDYHAVKPNRLHFDCQQGLDHVFGDYRKWKKTPKS